MSPWIWRALACTGPADKGTDTQDTQDTQDSGAPAVEVAISVDLGDAWAIQPNVAGFNLNLANSGIAPWDPRLEDAFLDLTPAAVRWPSGIGYTADWRTGQVDTDWALRFHNDLNCTDDAECEGGDSCQPRPTGREPDAKQCWTPCTLDIDCGAEQICLVLTNEDGVDLGQCLATCPGGDDATCASDEDCFKVDADRFACMGDKTEKYLGYQETIKGKGYQPLVDTAELVERTGGRLEIHINGTSNSAAEAGALAEYVLEKGIKVDLYAIAIETFYFRKPTPPTLWASGWDYAEDLRAHVAAIQQAHLPLDAPPISISFSDAENSWQRVWDEGNESAPGAADSRPGIGDSVFANGAFFTAADAHWYPGEPATPLEEVPLLVNQQLTHDAPGLVDDWFLALGSGVDGDGAALRPTMVFTEYNVQATWRTSLAMVHAAEFVARMAAHPDVSLLGYHSLTEGCMDVLTGHRETATDAGIYGRYGVMDSAALGTDGDWGHALGEHWSMPCLALRLAHEAVNPATHALSTTVAGGAQVEAVDEDELSSWVPAVHAQAFRGPEHNHLLITNRSDEAHTITLDGLGSAGEVHSLAGEVFNWRNCGGGESNTDDETCRPGGDLPFGVPVAWDGGPIGLPPWGVVRVKTPRELADVAAPSGLVAVAGGRSATVSWGAVPDAEAYELRWGVRDGLHRHVRIPATETSHTLMHLGAGVAHSVQVAAVMGDETGPFAGAVSVTPTRDLVHSDDFSSDDLATSLPTQSGSATWAVTGGALTVDATSGVQARLRDDGWRNGNIEVRFKLDCDCSVAEDEAEACGRMGLVGRHTDDADYLVTYLDHDDEGCFFRIWNKGGVGAVARSAYIGVPIVDSNGAAPINPLPQVPAIDDGELPTLRFQMEEAVVRTWLDGRLIVAGLDNTSTGTGTGTYVRTQSAEFDDLQTW